MIRSWIPLALLLALCNALTTNVKAWQNNAEPMKLAFQDGQSAGVRFQLQGEYVGSVKVDGNEMNIGVQVIAGKDNSLGYVVFVGGLPGDGASGDELLRGTGEIKGETAVLHGDSGSGEIINGVLSVFDTDHNELGKLKKVQRQSPTLGAKPPVGAVILFDGTSADSFENGRMTEDKLLMEGVTSKDKFQDFELHLEFRLAFMPNAKGQARANSGCYLQGRYEVQILDSFGLEGLDNECGGIYKVSRPELNMCYPPLSWQTYDIQFRAAKFDDSGKKVSNARVTVKHNGTVIHQDRELPTSTPGGPWPKEGPEAGPLFLQDHSDPIRFRNIWVKPL